MFYVIEIMDNRTCQLIGPKSWEECQEIMTNILDGINQYSLEDIESGHYKENDYCVEIIQAEE